MKVFRSSLGLAFLVSIHLSIILSDARAQSNDGTEGIVSRALAATVDYGNDAIFQPGKHPPDFDLLGVRPAAVLTITVQFPAELAGQTMIVEPLDGGTLTFPDGGFVVTREPTSASAAILKSKTPAP